MSTDFSMDKRQSGLTERRIRDAKPGPKTILLRDREVVGLAVRIAPGGTKAYVLDYRANGRRRLATLARCSEISLKEARTRAARELVGIRMDGADPVRERRDGLAAPTVNDGLDRFFREYAPRRIEQGRLTERTLADYRAQAKRTVRPGLGNIKIADVTRADVERAVAKRAPVQRNRTLALISRVFTVFEQWEYRPQHTNPARLVERSREQPRDRVLAPSEIEAIGAALAACDDPFAAAALRFLMLTGWRNGEALALEWDAVNFETGEVVLPSTKTGRSVRTVDGIALQAIADLPRINRVPGVFAGLSYASLWRRWKTVCEAAGIDGVRLHDIRRTVATGAAAAGMSAFLLRDLMGHKTLAMANRYVRAGSALQEAQAATASRMAGMMKGEGGEVVPLRRTGANRPA